jgi:hypothetical protein
MLNIFTDDVARSFLATQEALARDVQSTGNIAQFSVALSLVKGRG